MDPGAGQQRGALFETTDELRLVYGATLDILLGEDTNRNGALDPNEDDGDQSPPHDNQDGQLQPGLLEYVTAFSNQPTTTINGGARWMSTNAGGRQRLMALMTHKGISGGNARTYMQRIGATVCNSVAQFMVQSRISAADFALIHTSIYVAPPTAFNKVEGLVNVNTASETVLASLPGIGPAVAASMVAYRQANPRPSLPSRGSRTFPWGTMSSAPSGLTSPTSPINSPPTSRRSAATAAATAGRRWSSTRARAFRGSSTART